MSNLRQEEDPDEHYIYMITNEYKKLYKNQLYSDPNRVVPLKDLIFRNTDPQLLEKRKMKKEKNLNSSSARKERIAKRKASRISSLKNKKLFRERVIKNQKRKEGLEAKRNKKFIDAIFPKKRSLT